MQKQTRKLGHFLAFWNMGPMKNMFVKHCSFEATLLLFGLNTTWVSSQAQTDFYMGQFWTQRSLYFKSPV